MPPDPQCSRLSYYLCNSSSKCVGPFFFAFFPLFSLPQMFHAFGSLPPLALTGLTPTTVVLTFAKIVDFNLLPLRFRLALPGFPLIFLRSIAESPVFNQPELPSHMKDKCNLHLELESFFSSLPQVSHFCFPKRPH